MNDPSGLQPWLRPYWELYCDVHQLVTGGYRDARGRLTGGTRPILTSTYRSYADQQELYKNRMRNPYPVNEPGDSAHQYGLAFDSDVPDAQQPLARVIREYLGLRVPDNDEVHAEVPGWRSLLR